MKKKCTICGEYNEIIRSATKNRHKCYFCGYEMKRYFSDCCRAGTATQQHRSIDFIDHVAAVTGKVRCLKCDLPVRKIIQPIVKIFNYD